MSNIKRRRFTRCCYGRSGLLPVYSERSARGQETVMFLNSERRTHDRYADEMQACVFVWLKCHPTVTATLTVTQRVM